jgi:Phosphopantetheine attachment site
VPAQAGPAAGVVPHPFATAAFVPPSAGAPAAYGSAPATPTERLVAEVWRTVLALDTVAVTDNFFDIGGHSMAMAKVAAQLEQRLGRAPRMVDLFGHPTIRTLAAHLDGASDDSDLLQAVERAAARRHRFRRPGNIQAEE